MSRYNEEKITSGPDGPIFDVEKISKYYNF